MKHLDLFSGIGGFALAADRVFGNVEHIFCDNDPFCQAILKKHWPQAQIYGNIDQLTWEGYVQNVKSPKLGRAGLIASPATLSESQSGESSIPSIIARLKQRGSGRQKKKSSATMEENVPAAGSQTEPSLASTTRMGAGISSAEHTSRKRGSSSSAMDTQPTTRSSATTAIMPNIITENAHTKIDILTGGFPCQPFSQAGRRAGTSDNRYKWPEMLRVIREFKPRWVIGENVGGFVTWSEGLVLEQVHADLEGEGYEVQAFIIPAVAVNAPHRRDRVWIVAHSDSSERGRTRKKGWNRRSSVDCCTPESSDAKHNGLSTTERLGNYNEKSKTSKKMDNGISRFERTTCNWDSNWLEVATRLCRVDDGLPRRLDRNPRLKALGNAIVPQVAEEIMKAIKQIESQ